MKCSFLLHFFFSKLFRNGSTLNHLETDTTTEIWIWVGFLCFFTQFFSILFNSIYRLLRKKYKVFISVSGWNLRACNIPFGLHDLTIPLGLSCMHLWWAVYWGKKERLRKNGVTIWKNTINKLMDLCQSSWNFFFLSFVLTKSLIHKYLLEQIFSHASSPLKD